MFRLRPVIALAAAGGAIVTVAVSVSDVVRCGAVPSAFVKSSRLAVFVITLLGTTAPVSCSVYEMTATFVPAELATPALLAPAAREPFVGSSTSSRPLPKRPPPRSVVARAVPAPFATQRSSPLPDGMAKPAGRESWNETPKALAWPVFWSVMAKRT